jgi:hypothetical protein
VRTVAALCLFALAIGGCGAAAKDSAKSFKGEQAAVAKVVEDLETAARKNKPDTVCTKLLSAKRLATLKEQGTNCKTAVKEAFEDADSFDLTVDKVAITGAAATITVKSGTGSDKKTDTLAATRSGAVWKLDSLG